MVTAARWAYLRFSAVWFGGGTDPRTQSSSSGIETSQIVTAGETAAVNTLADDLVSPIEDAFAGMTTRRG